MTLVIARSESGCETRIAPARVFFTLCAYFGFARKVSWSGPACSIPATPLISRSSFPRISQPRAPAISLSFMHFSVSSCLFLRRRKSGNITSWLKPPPSAPN